MPGDIHEKPFDEGTITKLEIFERYLEAWLPVFIHSPRYNNVNICDFFAGPGSDTLRCPGSPLRILRTIEKFQDDIVRQNLQITVVLNELLREKVEQLKSATMEEIDRLSEGVKNLLSVEYHSEEFRQLFNKRYADLEAQPNLIFIDQNGVKEVNDAVFEKLIALKVTDFLFFISSSSFRRFAEEDSFRSSHPDFDVDRLRNARYENTHLVVLEYYKGKIPAGNDTRLYPFSIKKGANIYGLVFGSKHPLGVEKFLNIAWKENSLNGQANFDIDDDIEKLEPTLFDDDPTFRRLTKIQLFERELEKYILNSREVTNREVYDFTLEQGHRPSHGHFAIMKLRRAGKIECDDRIGCSYRSCHSNDANIKTLKVVNDG